MGTLVLGHRAPSLRAAGRRARSLRIDVDAERTPRCRARGESVDGLADRGDRGAPVGAFTTTWLRSLPRRRKSGAGPRT